MSKKFVKLMKRYRAIKKKMTAFGSPVAVVVGESVLFDVSRETEMLDENTFGWISALFPPDDPTPVEIRYPNVINLMGYYVDSNKQWYLWGPVVIQPIEIPAPIAWRKPKPTTPKLPDFSAPDGWISTFDPPNDNRKVLVMQADKATFDGRYSPKSGWVVDNKGRRRDWVIAWREI